MVYYIYLILAVLCFIGELFSMDFSLACFGVGLLGAAGVSALGLGLGWQVLVFIVVAGALFVGIRPLALKHLYHANKHVKMNVDALIGRRVTVLTAPDGENIGRVQTDGDNWRAQFAAPAVAGEEVQVEKVDGNTLFVVPIQTQEEK